MGRTMNSFRLKSAARFRGRAGEKTFEILYAP
jgi:hypothetical protein